MAAVLAQRRLEGGSDSDWMGAGGYSDDGYDPAVGSDSESESSDFEGGGGGKRKRADGEDPEFRRRKRRVPGGAGAALGADGA